jgi:hypothetical protein
LSTLFVGGVLIIGTVLLCLSYLRPRYVAVLVVRADVPANRILSEGDISLGVRRAGSDDGFAAHAVGRLTVRNLARGSAVRDDDLGPDVQEALGRDAQVVGVRTTDAGALGGALRTGDPVRVSITVGRQHFAARGLVVAVRAVRRPERPYTVDVALKPSLAERYARVSTRAAATVALDLGGRTGP